MKMPICGIYKITSPVGKMYIGRAISISSRWYEYKYLKCKRQPKLYNSLKKYGPENHKFEVLEECAEELLNEREVYYIKLFDTFDTPHGLNLQSGGDARKPSEETKLKIGIGNKGKVQTKESNEKNRQAHLNVKQSPETIAKRIERKRINEEKKIEEKRRKKIEYNSEEARLKRKQISEDRNRKRFERKKTTPEWIEKQKQKELERIRKEQIWNSDEARKRRSEIASIRNKKNREKKLKENPDWISERRNNSEWIKQQNERILKRKQCQKWNSEEMIGKRYQISERANNAKREIRQERLTMIF